MRRDITRRRFVVEAGLGLETFRSLSLAGVEPPEPPLAPTLKEGTESREDDSIDLAWPIGVEGATFSLEVSSAFGAKTVANAKPGRLGGLVSQSVYSIRLRTRIEALDSAWSAPLRVETRPSRMVSPIAGAGSTIDDRVVLAAIAAKADGAFFQWGVVLSDGTVSMLQETEDPIAVLIEHSGQAISYCVRLSIDSAIGPGRNEGRWSPPLVLAKPAFGFLAWSAGSTRRLGAHLLESFYG